jgi:cell division control protein 11
LRRPPVIGRADSCTPSELRDFKRRIMEDIEHHQIAVWDFPDDVEDDAATIADNAELRASLPFALVGSEDEMIIQGKLVRVRR